MVTARMAAAILAATLALTGCNGESKPPLASENTYSEAEIAGSLAPSPATIAMRWQWLNPAVNSFTFRDTQDVFAYRVVDGVGGGHEWELPGADGFTMPPAAVAGEQADY